MIAVDLLQQSSHRSFARFAGTLAKRAEQQKLIEEGCLFDLPW